MTDQLSKMAATIIGSMVIPRKRWLCPDMTEKLFNGTLSKNETKRKSYVNTATLGSENNRILFFNP